MTNSGTFDGTVVYLYDGQKIVETRNGSNAVVQQFIHGTQYIDELVMVRVKDKGDLYVHQDANWNVFGLTDQGRHLVERYVYTPYGEVLVNQETSFGDRDGDNDVDSTDKGTVGVTCTGTVSGSCRILDLDFDGDYDSTDATAFDALSQGLARHPGRTSTGVGQPFAHQGLPFEPEIGSYQNRARQYDPGKRRFEQRDPLGLTNTANPQLEALYACVASNPTRWLDPTGLCPCSPAHVSFCLSDCLRLGKLYVGCNIVITFWNIILHCKCRPACFLNGLLPDPYGAASWCEYACADGFIFVPGNRFPCEPVYPDPR